MIEFEIVLKILGLRIELKYILFEMKLKYFLLLNGIKINNLK